LRDIEGRALRAPPSEATNALLTNHPQITLPRPTSFAAPHSCLSLPCQQGVFTSTDLGIAVGLLGAAVAAATLLQAALALLLRTCMPLDDLPLCVLPRRQPGRPRAGHLLADESDSATPPAAQQRPGSAHAAAAPRPSPLQSLTCSLNSPTSLGHAASSGRPSPSSSPTLCLLSPSSTAPSSWPQPPPPRTWGCLGWGRRGALCCGAASRRPRRRRRCWRIGPTCCGPGGGGGRKNARGRGAGGPRRGSSPGAPGLAAALPDCGRPNDTCLQLALTTPIRCPAVSNC
jgi:hypothetical protein